MTSNFGLIMVCAAVVMFLIAIPRRGEPVGFLRNRDSLQAGYMILLILLLTLGTATTLSNWN